LDYLVRKQMDRYERIHGRPLDFERAWWTPPLTARQAFDLERSSIESKLNCPALVSLSDHDDIEAGSTLQVLNLDIPISVEWTVPFGPSFFHIGVHNLPPEGARAIFAQLRACTRKPTEPRIAACLDMLNRAGNVLVILNHPLWDEPGIGYSAHLALLDRFLTAYSGSLHALEINGLRSWKENRDIYPLAERWNLPAVSGGDRHAREPNSVVNLTTAGTFDEFVSEVRHDKWSVIEFMHHYREPIRLRLMQNVLDVIRDYDFHPEGRRRWSDRVFFEREDGSVRSLSELWTGDGPMVVRMFLASVHLLEAPAVRGALRFALNEREESFS
jgi:hypothetical protein